VLDVQSLSVSKRFILLQTDESYLMLGMYSGELKFFNIQTAEVQIHFAQNYFCCFSLNIYLNAEKQDSKIGKLCLDVGLM